VITVSKPARAILPLLRAPITDITDTSLTISIGALYGAPTTIRVDVPTGHYDLRTGDIVTLYTEVLLKGPTDAPTNN
jgi:hypothetical protein